MCDKSIRGTRSPAELQQLWDETLAYAKNPDHRATQAVHRETLLFAEYGIPSKYTHDEKNYNDYKAVFRVEHSVMTYSETFSAHCVNDVIDNIHNRYGQTTFLVVYEIITRRVYEN